MYQHQHQHQHPNPHHRIHNPHNPHLSKQTSTSPSSALVVSPQISSSDTNTISPVFSSSFSPENNSSTSNHTANNSSSRVYSSLHQSSPLFDNSNGNFGSTSSAKQNITSNKNKKATTVATAKTMGDNTSEKSGVKNGRATLACHRCRQKRARCSTDRPVCHKCAIANAECVYPEGRKRKRTRKEMEEAERTKLLSLADGHNIISDDSQENHHHHHHQQQQQNDNHDFYNSLNNHNTTFSNSSQSTYSPSFQLPITSSSTPSQNNMYSWPPPIAPNITQQSPQKPRSLSYLPLFHHDDDGSTEQNFDLTDQEKTQSEAMIRAALEQQVAYIEGDPHNKDNSIELFYYRFYGSTAIHPGIHRISLKLQPKQSTTPGSANAPLPGPSVPSNPHLVSPPTKDLSLHIFDDTGSPTPAYYGPLIDLFFRNLSQHFPSISKKRLKERFETKTMSAFYLNCICAISARFSIDGVGNAAHACAPFIGKAQELIAPLLHLPANDVVTGLLLLAWACYGQNSESGLWEYTGMAFRMCVDLGLHEVSEIYESEDHVVRTRLLFWSLFITDRIISFATGRPSSIPEDIIEIPLPEDSDFFPDPSRSDESSSAAEPLEPVPFPQMARLMVLLGRISNLINSRTGKKRTLVNNPEPSLEILADLQSQLVHFYGNLPESLRWSVDAFKHQESRGHGGSFLALHLWANAILTFIYHPDLLISNFSQKTGSINGVKRSQTLALACSRTISECLVMADLFASHTYTATPFLAQPLHVASLAFIDEIKQNQHLDSNKDDQNDHSGNNDYRNSTDGSPASFMISLARQNLSVLMRALKRVEQYWTGTCFVLNVLDPCAAEVGQPQQDNNNARVKNTFISLPDQGLLTRFKDKDSLAHNTAPATKTSLRDSKREKSNTITPYTIDDLLSGYIVEDLLVAPATSGDIQHLIGG